MSREQIKLMLWGAVAGAAALAIVTFSAGWVVTSGTAEQTAREQAQQAVVKALAPICVARAQNDPQRETRLAALQEERSWQRHQTVRDYGWSIMPGSDTSNRDVADACAEQLVKSLE